MEFDFELFKDKLTQLSQRVKSGLDEYRRTKLAWLPKKIHEASEYLKQPAPKTPIGIYKPLVFDKKPEFIKNGGNIK